MDDASRIVDMGDHYRVVTHPYGQILRWMYPDGAFMPDPTTMMPAEFETREQAERALAEVLKRG
jgi:hypothetical protein